MLAEERAYTRERTGMIVSKLAVIRRLQAVGAFPEERDLVFGCGRQAMWNVMLRELAAAHLLSRRAHRLISHPERARRNDMGQQYWVNDLLYVVVGDTIATVCILTSEQIDSLEQVEGRSCPVTQPALLTQDQLVDAIYKAMDELTPRSGVRSMNRVGTTRWAPQVLDAPSTVNRQMLKFPRWFSAGGSIHLIVVPSHVVFRDQLHDISNCTTRWMRRELCGNRPNTLWYDPSSEMARSMIQKFRRTRCLPFAVESLEEPLDAEVVTRPAYALWKQLLGGDTPTLGRLMVLVTPTVASKLVRLIVGPAPSETAENIQQALGELTRRDFAKWGRRVVSITGTSVGDGMIRCRCEIKTLY